MRRGPATVRWSCRETADPRSEAVLEYAERREPAEILVVLARGPSLDPGAVALELVEPLPRRAAREQHVDVARQRVDPVADRLGGLMVSQILTLFTTPVTYLAMGRFAGWLRRVFRRPPRDVGSAIVPR